MTTTSVMRRQWRAVVSSVGGKQLLRVRVRGEDCKAAEANALAVAALNLRMGPQELKVWRLAEIQPDWAREEVCA